MQIIRGLLIYLQSKHLTINNMIEWIYYKPKICLLERHLSIEDIAFFKSEAIIVVPNT